MGRLYPISPCRPAVACYRRAVTGADELPPLAVLDIDGVLADVRHRLHHIGPPAKDWERFFTAAADDPPLAVGTDLARELQERHEVLYLTGRPERTRTLTERWLSEHGLPAGTLLMRPDGDHRPARMFKLECLRALRASRDVALVIDDDPEVVDQLRADGFPIRLADWLPYAEPLRAGQEHDGHT